MGRGLDRLLFVGWHQATELCYSGLSCAGSDHGGIGQPPGRASLGNSGRVDANCLQDDYAGGCGAGRGPADRGPHVLARRRDSGTRVDHAARRGRRGLGLVATPRVAGGLDDAGDPLAGPAFRCWPLPWCVSIDIRTAPCLPSGSVRSCAEPAIGSFNYARPSLVFYTGQRIEKFQSAADIAEFFRTHPHDAFFFTTTEQYALIADAIPADVQVIDAAHGSSKRARCCCWAGRWSRSIATASRKASPQLGVTL